MQANKKIAVNLMHKLSEARKRIEELELLESSIKKRLTELLRDTKDQKLEDGELSASYVQATKIVYNIEEMQEVFKPSVLKRLVDIEYTVDKAAMREFLEDHPEFKGQIAAALQKKLMPNVEKIEAAYERRLISTEEIRKCSKITTVEYTRMTEKGKN